MAAGLAGMLAWGAGPRGALGQGADAPPGRVERVEGEVGFKQPGDGGFKPDPQIAGRRMDPGDQLKTLPAAKAHVSLPLGVVALAQAESILVFDRAGTKAQAALLEGQALFALTRPLDRGWSFSVRTHSALAIVDSGVCWISTDEDRSSRFRVLVGSTRVRADGRTVRLRPGQEIRVPFGARPGEPGPAEEPRISTGSFAIGGSLSGAEQAWERR